MLEWIMVQQVLSAESHTGLLAFFFRAVQDSCWDRIIECILKHNRMHANIKLLILPRERIRVAQYYG